MNRPTRGRLIAIDGSGPMLPPAKDVARILAQASIPRGVSPWDASGIFTELAAAHPDVEPPSARTLTLLYAADLAFRLRWQILPALEEGRSVIAAPYVHTAKALGHAAGIPRKWLDDLFRFVPRPDASYHAPRPRQGDGGQGQDAPRANSTGYVECFAAALLRGGAPLDAAALKKRTVDYLAVLEKRRQCLRLTGTVLAKVAR
jgi:hypothetical protein